jgi:hypothetical protein
MTKVLVILMSTLVFTGCASTQPGEPGLGSKIMCGYGVCTKEVRDWANGRLFEKANNDCRRMGYKAGSPQFSQCVQYAVENERTRVSNENIARSQSTTSFGSSKQVHCTNDGYNIRCREF